MDMLKNVTGGGSDKPKAEEPKPDFVASTKLAAEAAHSNVTGAATNVVETARGYAKSGQDAVGKAQTNVIDQSEKAKTTLTGTATNVVETARGYIKSGQEAVGNCLNQAGQFIKPAAAPPADAPKAAEPPAAKE